MAKSTISSCEYRPYMDKSAVDTTRLSLRCRPDLQSCRMVSGSGSYGKDRIASAESQQHISYPDITRASMNSNNDKRLLRQESNVPAVYFDTRSSNVPIPAMHNDRPRYATFGKDQNNELNSYSPAGHQNNSRITSVSYSVIPNNSPGCRTCNASAR